jgi:hypothetical protein
MASTSDIRQEMSASSIAPDVVVTRRVRGEMNQSIYSGRSDSPSATVRGTIIGD